MKFLSIYGWKLFHDFNHDISYDESNGFEFSCSQRRDCHSIFLL